MTTLNSRIVKCGKGTFWNFNMFSVAKYQNLEGGTFGDIKQFQKSLTKSKNGRSRGAKRGEKGDTSVSEWFFISG